MRFLRVSVLAGIPIIMALMSVVMGRDANWDFINYRWYDPYALLHGRLTLDVLVAEHATFYNPILELPFYLLATHTPAVVAGFFMALAGTLAFVPFCLLAEQSLVLDNRTLRFAVAAAIGLCGLLGGGVLGQIGIVSWDLPLATPTLFALYGLCRNRAQALTALPERTWPTLTIAGLLAGGAAGLKLTAAIYPLGIALALLIASRGGPRPRLSRMMLFSVAAGIGLLLCGGYWMWRLYEAFGNPVFPYFNDVFHSPFASAGGNRDGTFLPNDWQTALVFPFLFTVNSLHVAEYHFRDVHIALACALAPITVIMALMYRHTAPRYVIPSVMAFLFVFAGISFVAWEFMFSIYRYILPLEMLASLLVVLAVLNLPLPGRVGPVLAILLLAASQCLISTGWNRRSWDHDYVQIGFPVSISQDSTLFLTGNAPMGFAVTALPDGVPALRIGSYLAQNNAFTALLRQRVAAIKGPMLALFAPGDETESVQTLSAYGLVMKTGGCGWMTSNVSAPLKLCPVSRL